MLRNMLVAFAALFTVNTAMASPAPDSFAPMLTPLMPAVVNISTTQKVSGMPGMPGFDFDQLGSGPGDEQFKEMLREFNKRFGTPEGNEREVTSLGSGFVIDPQGYVVTNSHVIADATEITVILQDDRHLPATIVGEDPQTDLALLRVKSDKPLPFVRFGDSDALNVGDWVVAVGNPFGLGGSVSAGIVSARGRNINAGPFDDFIQTDAAVNRGNSGGPLFNTRGEVVGINSAIFSPTGGSVGISFAVPSAMAKPIVEQLRQFGRTHRGWLGVKIQEVTDEMAEALGLGSPRGALVLEVNGPAEGSGLMPGDVIVKFQGREIKQMRTLPRLVAETKAGTKVAVTALRKGKEREFSVTLGELPTGKEAAAKRTRGDEQPKPTRGSLVLGMQLKSAPEGGVLVTALDRTGSAAKNGIIVGDVILDVNQVPIKSGEELAKQLTAAQKEGKEHALLRVKRKSGSLFVTVPVK